MDAPGTFARLVLDDPESASDLEMANDIHLRFADMGRAYGFTYECSRGHKHVVINDSRSREQQTATYFHESYHSLASVLPAGPAEAEAERHGLLQVLGHNG